jgi:hypothetical protein
MYYTSILGKKEKEFNSLIGQLKIDNTIIKASIPLYKDDSISAKLVVTRRDN